MDWQTDLESSGPASMPETHTHTHKDTLDTKCGIRENLNKNDIKLVVNCKLTDARLCEELECLLGAREEIPLMVSLLRVLGLIICRPVNGPVERKTFSFGYFSLDVDTPVTTKQNFQCDFFPPSKH